MQSQRTLRPLGNLGVAAALSLSLLAIASAQTGYRVTQGQVSTAEAGTNTGPVRMARFAYTSGTVTWRTDTTADWSNAKSNLPLRQGAQVWVNNGSKAEVQFDDGSRLRLGNGTSATLQTMYSDNKGEFTELKLNEGLASLTLTSPLSLYQIDTPKISIKAYGPSKVRIGCGGDVEVCCRKGQAQVLGSQGTATLNRGQYVDVPDTSRPLRIAQEPPPDSWDTFTDHRDDWYAQPQPYVPATVGVMSGNLAVYGSWNVDARYGHVWYPHHMYAGWRPYHDGNWVWVDPYGWTWVGDEPWGWAPYHYGTWIQGTYGWGWCPGPAVQFWSPAVVSFSCYNGSVAWCPLAPFEVGYPAGISFGFTSGNWAFSFGIGAAAAFYPSGIGLAIGIPWGNGYVNRPWGGWDPGRIHGYYARGGFGGRGFVPAYSRNAGAISRVTTAGFVGGGRAARGTAADPAMFRRGISYAGRGGAGSAFSPGGVRPTRAALTANRSFGATHPAAGVLNRSVVRAPVSAAVARASTPMGRTVAASTRPAAVARGAAAVGANRAIANRVNAARSHSTAAHTHAARVAANHAHAAARTNYTRAASRTRSSSARTRSNAVAHANTARSHSSARSSYARSTSRPARSYASTGRTRSSSPMRTSSPNRSFGRQSMPSMRSMPRQSAPPMRSMGGGRGGGDRRRGGG